MGNCRIPKLCAGVFFDFLQMTARSRKLIIDGEYKRKNNKEDRLGDANIMGGFVEVLTGENPDPDGERIRSEVTEFRKCQKNGSVNLPFDEDNDPTGCIDSFLKSFDHGYDKLINRAVIFRKTYINTENDGKLSNFVEAVLGVIAHDSIQDTEVFYVTDNDTPIRKDDLIKSDCIVFEPFILGIMRWIFESKRKNSIEKGHFTDWMEQDSSNRWVLRKDVNFSEGISHVDVKYADKVVLRDKAVTVNAYCDRYDVLPEDYQEDIRMSSGEQHNTIQNARVINVSGNGIYIERIDKVETLNDIRDKK